MQGRKDDDDRGIFRALSIEYRGRKGRYQTIEFADTIADLATVEVGDQKHFDLVNTKHSSDVAIEDIAIISFSVCMILSPSAILLRG